MKYINNFFLFFLSALSLFASSLKEEQIMRINYLEGDPKTFSPQLFRDTYTATLFKSLYEGLTRINLNGEVELALAKKIEVSKCKTKYIIYLRPSKWANGEELTASHFVDAWKLAIKPNTKCVQPYRFFPIKNAEKIFQGKLPLEKIGLFAPKKDKIVIYLEHPTPYFTQLLADPIYSPMYDLLDYNNYVFNGPFVIKKFQPGKELQLKKNLSFWDGGNVKLDGVIISFIRDISIVYELYKKGKLDFVGSPFSDFSTEIIEEVKNINKKEICAIHWLHVNTKHPKLSSKSIRKALSLAIDRDYIANEILLNANPNSLILPSKLSQLETLKKVKKAKELFKEGLLELGCKIEDFVITLSYSYLNRNVSLAEYLKYQWEKTFNIKIVLDKSDWITFISKLRSDNFCLGGTTRYTTFEHPLYFLEYFYSAQNNYSKWENSDFQKSIDLANNAISNKMCKKFLEDAEMILEDECPVISLYTHKHLYLCNPKLKNFSPGNLAYTDFRWAYFE